MLLAVSLFRRNLAATAGRGEKASWFAFAFDFQPSMNMPVFRFAAGQAPGGRVAQQTVVWQAKRGRNGRPAISKRRPG